MTSTHVDTSVLTELRRAIEKSGIESSAQAQLLVAIEAMQKAHNTPRFVDHYKEFIALAANYMTIIGPFLPALSDLLRGSHS
jgi:hypothetical protein